MPVPVSEFGRDFERYRAEAELGPVALSAEGKIAGYFIDAAAFEDYQRFRAFRHSFATEDLPEALVAEIGATRMDGRHAALDALLEDGAGG